MKVIEVENQKYELIKDYKNGFNLDEFQNSYTDYFEDYDYVVGDIAYSKLRLKGKGIVSMKNKNMYGDEYVTLQIAIPKHVSEHEREFLEKIREMGH